MRTKFSRIGRYSLHTKPGPTPEKLKALLKEYAVRRWQAARMAGVEIITFNRYCLPVTSKHHCPMPYDRWLMMRKVIKHTIHPDREIELPGEPT